MYYLISLAFLLLFLLCLCQGFLPFNPQHIEGNSWHLAFNTASSFMTNTNWQAYSGENALSYFTQFMGLTVQNFVSAATGIAVLFAFIRGLIKVKSQGLGELLGRSYQNNSLHTVAHLSGNDCTPRLPGSGAELCSRRQPWIFWSPLP